MPHLPHHQVIFLPVVSQLHLPLKVLGAAGALGQQAAHDVTAVHVDGDQRCQQPARQAGHVTTHQPRQPADLLDSQLCSNT